MNNLTNINTELLPNEYAEWRKNIEDLIEVSKLRTAINVKLICWRYIGILEYWNIGKSILQKQEERGWGTKVIDQLSKDLSVKFPDDRGYSVRNLKYMRQFAEAYPQFPIVQVPLAQLEGNQILKKF